MEFAMNGLKSRWDVSFRAYWGLIPFFCLLALAFQPTRVWSQQAGYGVCSDEGGIEECKDPKQVESGLYNVDDPGIPGGPYSSESSLYSAFLSNCWPQQVIPAPPWTFSSTGGSLPGSTTWEASVTATGNLSACNQNPVIQTSTWRIRKTITLSCPDGYTPVSTHTTNHPLGYCYIPKPPRCAKCVSNPIDPSIGNKMQEEVDYSGGAHNVLRFVRSYNYFGADIAPHPVNGSLGTAWTHTYERRLSFYSNGSVRVGRPDGNDRTFLLVSGAYQEFDTQTERLLPVNNGSATKWQFIDEQDNVESYDINGLLLSIAYRGGQSVTLTYSTVSTPASIAPDAGYLIAVTDGFGHALNFTYSAGGLLATMSDPSGGVYTYANSSGVLSSVTYPDSTVRQYVYNESAYTQGTNLKYALTGIIDESSVRFATFGYNSVGQAVSSQHAGGVEHYSVSPGYSESSGSGYSYFTDPLGAVRYYTYQSVNGAIRFMGNSGYCSTCSGAPKSMTYDSNGNVASSTDFNNRQTVYSYDLVRNLETSRTEGYGTPRARTIATTWDSSWREPGLIVEFNRTTAFAYDSSGNALSKTVTDTSVTPNVARTWTYNYDVYGHVLTADGPRTDVSDTTTYTYYTCTTGYECGQLHTVTNAAGQTTTYSTYNAHGQPLTLTDPNGVVTTLTYDSHLRLTSRQTGSETTTFDYWPTGLLKKVMLPDASYLLYTYDTAHRLTQISDALGNQIVYTLDVLGNRTAENSYDPGNTLHRTHTRVFNTLNQLYKDVNAAGTAAVTTTYGYDSQGNQTSIAAPLSRSTANAYDELNRLKQITDPASGVTQFSYDANDNLTSVIDPRTLTTSYTYSGFGDLKTQVSPDTGTTTNTYDSGGNLATSTDARGAVATYTYDALNRVTSVAYSSGGTTDQTIAFTYDAGTNGAGHLTGASDANHSIAWTYDVLGRVTSKGQTVGSVTKSVNYGYNSGNLASLTTPSGQTVAYGYNANHQVTSVSVNGTTVLNSVSYEPLGPLSGWTWGNGTSTTRAYDTDGKISQIVSAGTKSFSYDNAFRIIGITDTSSGSANWTYGYDALDRLTSGASASVTRGWTYDANGNRLTETGSAPSTYSIASTSNQISSISGALARTYTYDAGGNTTGYSTVSATYNNAGRLKTLAQGGTTETIVYNALGQRVKISGGSTGTVLYAYDEAGHLLGEYDGTGTLIEETVWLGDIPVATLRPSGAGVSMYYVHSDQLNTPRQVTRPSDNVQMWSWFSDPFGTDAANANPASVGTFAYNLRFPGQVFDGQAGLHQNYFRDFDPATGKYTESDPVGLKGGTNTYMYAMDAPIQFADPFGLWPTGLLFNQLPKTDDCKPEEVRFCNRKCAPARSLGCYVTLSWKLKGFRGGEPIRSEQRNVECDCEELDGCIPAPKKGKRGSSSISPVIPPWWWWATEALMP